MEKDNAINIIGLFDDMDEKEIKNRYIEKIEYYAFELEKLRDQAHLCSEREELESKKEELEQAYKVLISLSEQESIPDNKRNEIVIPPGDKIQFRKKLYMIVNITTFFLIGLILLIFAFICNDRKESIAHLKVHADAECRISIDGIQYGVMKKGEQKLFEVKFGEHYILAETMDNFHKRGTTIKWDKSEVHEFQTELHSLINRSLDKEVKKQIEPFANNGINISLDDNRLVKPETLLATGIKKFYAGKYLEAIKDFDYVIEFKPSLVEAYYYRGRSNFNLKRNYIALTDLNQAVKINSNYTEAIYFRGLVKNEMNKDKEAIEDFTLVISLNKDNVYNAYKARVKTNLKLRAYESMKRDCDKLIGMNSNDQENHFYHGIANFYTNRFDYAIEDFNKLLQIDLKNEEAFYYKGRCNLNLKKFALAIEDFSKAIRIFPKYGPAFYYRGIAKQNARDISSACLDWKQAQQYSIKEAEELIKQYCR